MVAGGLVLAAPATPAYAGPYFNDWPGITEVNYVYEGTVARSFVPPIPDLEQVFNNEWSANETMVCGEIESLFAAYTSKAGFSFKDWSCNLPSTGDLEGAPLGPGEVGLEYGLTDASLAVDIDVLGDWINFTGSVNAQLDIDLNVATSINGSLQSSSPLYASSPASLVSSEVTFSDADLSTANTLLHLLAPGLEGFVENLVDSSTLSNVAARIGLPAAIVTTNNALNGVAGTIAAPLLAADPLADVAFGLGVGVDSQHVIFTYTLGGSPEPKPAGCAYYPDDTNPGYTQVDAICSPDQAAGVTQLQLQEDNGGNWTDDPLDTSFEPGAPRGPENSFLGNPPYTDWAPNNGPDSGYAPYMTDYPPYQWSTPGVEAPTVEMRVCSISQYGPNCLPAVNVVQNTETVGGGGGGGGGGGSGEGSVSGPPVAPIQKLT
jgi:hypothetical protein